MSKQDEDTSSPFFNLEKVVQQYGEQRDLLELILSSKVEEDRRRAEEAKLRQKEIDYLLQQHTNTAQQQQQQTRTYRSPPTPMTTSMDNNNNNCGSRQHPITMHNHPQQIEPRQVYQPMLPSFPPPDKLPILPATSRRLQRPTAARRRRRREMQAISTIIETREFPYNDDYLWKNNGNTVHKKSGFRSIYYKCSNSAKGCPVNKTVTFKEHGNYLIKYRGEHLDECNRIKRIVDV
ncbi:hypothetical protein BDB00DRAFT_884199 [Zychaea mexicana]|uniref:uncharacterized protein n=1 Tax=Zychaea mexicana TaxID=64656 RepID=UPI0022FEDEDD|nr:uncharacterized protein BDB00DRAFT_884199 [Zychaea mexicana]KAI9490347.1 hypothetical protein BDB00DRAFT_884199 [Zychaea mexicana]